MNWMDQVGGLLQQYAGGTAGGSVHDDYDQVARSAPPDVLAQGIAGALRSNQTPPLAQMAMQMFGQGNGNQRADLLNTIIAAVGPALVSQVLSGQGQGPLAGLLGGGRVTPEIANQIPPQAVGQLAAQAEQSQPGVFDQLGGMLSGQPDMLKSLGGPALGAVLSRLVR